MATSLRQREMNDEAAKLMRRLDALAATLEHLAGNRADSTWLQGRQSADAGEDLSEPASGRGGRLHWPGRE